jgi:phosphoribosylformimino-5-aminoimidazole carboxamide ribotide isomerase
LSGDGNPLSMPRPGTPRPGTSPPRLYPAVDILDGKAVRLVQGRFDEGTVYDAKPLDAALRWVEQGAEALHVVDLDGARAGRPVALDHLRSIAAAATVPVQYGGGLRSADHLREALEAGASRVVLGTTAFTDEAVLEQALSEHGSKIAVAIDVRGGRVATAGWTSTTEIDGASAVAAMRRKGVPTVVYTNVDRDGMLSGIDLEEAASIGRAAGEMRLVWSGGVGALDDLRALASGGPENLAGVIVGKALYEGRFTVGEALRALGS